MRKAFIVLLSAAFLAGCSSTRVDINAHTGAGPGKAQAASGTSVTSGSAGLQVRGGSNSLAAVMIAVALIAGAVDHARDPKPMPSPAALLPEYRAPAPDLAPDRRVNEQDCSRPIVDASANLRCR